MLRRREADGQAMHGFIIIILGVGRHGGYHFASYFTTIHHCGALEKATSQNHRFQIRRRMRQYEMNLQQLPRPRGYDYENRERSRADGLEGRSGRHRSWRGMSLAACAAETLA